MKSTITGGVIIPMKGKIFEIKRFAVHDGDGIRTTVFLKGCPLRCLWCHNPEGLSMAPQIAYYTHKCIGCGECVDICPSQAHTFQDDMHFYNPDLCRGCGNCAEDCLGDALTFYYKEMTVEELLPLLLEDREFYENSGGGVTLSGGECLLQADFCAVLLKELKNQGIRTAVDTCGLVSKEALDQVIPYTDVFLYDVKAYDEDVHIRCTGQSNAQILENLRYLDALGCSIEIRIPYVPSYNDDQMEKIASFLAGLDHIAKIRVLAYHNYAESKYAALHLENTLPEQLPTAEELQQVKALVERITHCTVL